MRPRRPGSRAALEEDQARQVELLRLPGAATSRTKTLIFLPGSA